MVRFAFGLAADELLCITLSLLVQKTFPFRVKLDLASVFTTVLSDVGKSWGGGWRGVWRSWYSRGLTQRRDSLFHDHFRLAVSDRG